MEKNKENNPFPNGYNLNDTLTPAQEVIWLRSYVKELKAKVTEAEKPLLFKIGVLESEKAEIKDLYDKLKKEVQSQEVIKKLSDKVAQIEKLNKVQVKALKKDEMIMELNRKSQEKNKTIERLRRDNEDLIIQLVQARKVNNP